MPVRRLRSLEATEATLWREPGSTELLATIRLLWSLSARLCPRRFPRGVYKHRTIDGANRRVEEWEAAPARAYRGV